MTTGHLLRWDCDGRSVALVGAKDASGADGFTDPYPAERVFNPRKFAMARSLRPAPANARALPWSVKEAMGKGLDTGFNALEPKEAVAGGMTAEAQGTLRFRVATRLGDFCVQCGAHFAFQLTEALPVQAAGRANG